MKPSPSDNADARQAAERAFALGTFAAARSYATTALAAETSDEQSLSLQLLKLHSVAPAQRGATFSAELDSAQYLATERGDRDALLRVYLLRLEYLGAQHRHRELAVVKQQIEGLLTGLSDPLVAADIRNSVSLNNT